jgi:hypothetical protein
MGLLDSLFNSDTYGGQGGGLLDFLRTAQMQNSQYQPNQPSIGFPDNQPSPLDNAQYPSGPNGAPSAPASFADRFNAMPNAPQPFNPSGRTFDAAQFNPATYAPNQAQPIAVGNYQMPRIGDAQQFAGPDPAALPPNAQPTQGGPLPAMQAPTTDISAQSRQPEAQSALPPAFGGTSILGRIGNPDGLIARLTGNDSRSIAQQNLRATFDATRQVLRQSGMSDQEATSKAMLAVLNPEAGKTILPEALTNKEKYQVISEDPLQGKKYGFVNDRDQTINGKPLGSDAAAGASQGLQAMTDKISAMRTSGATKEQLLNQIPTGYREDVDSLLTGKGVPANMGRAQSRMAILTLAKVVDPSFDETLIPTRIAMRKDFSGEGKNGQAIGSFNTAQHHIDKLSDDLEQLSKYNGNFPTINAARSWLATNANTNPKLRDSMQAVNDDMAAVSHEVANAYNTGHLSDHDMSTWNKLTNTDLPPDQLRRGISDFVDLLNGKRDSLNHMYQQTFKEDAPTIDKEKNDAITTKVHSRLPGYASGGQGGLPSGWSVKVH